MELRKGKFEARQRGQAVGSCVGGCVSSRADGGGALQHEGGERSEAPVSTVRIVTRR